MAQDPPVRFIKNCIEITGMDFSLEDEETEIKLTGVPDQILKQKRGLNHSRLQNIEVDQKPRSFISSLRIPIERISANCRACWASKS